MSKIATIGASDAALFDLSSGALSGAGGTVVIDEDIMARIAFIKEGEFSEVRGKPTLKLIGEVKSVEAGKLVLGEKKSRSRPQAIDSDLIIQDFLEEKPVEGAFEFARAIASGNTPNLPIYYFLYGDNISLQEVTKYLAGLNTRGAKQRSAADAPERETHALLKKNHFRRLCEKGYVQSKMA